MRVRVGRLYTYEANGMDQFHPVPGNTLKKGDVVKVVNLPSAPKANTMGQCYVDKDGEFSCMVSTSSLTPHKPEKKRDKRVLRPAGKAV